MVIFDDNTTLNNLNARLRDREIGVAQFIKPVTWVENSLKPYTGKSVFKWKPLTLSIEFSAENQITLERNKAKAVKLFDGRFIVFSDFSEWRYFCVMDGEPSISDNIHGRYQTVTFNLLAYAETADETTAVYDNPGFIYDDNIFTETPVTMEVSGADSVTINLGDDAFIVNEIGSGVVTIADGKVLKNGLNHWNKISMKSWPKLSDYKTNVSFTPGSATVKIKYRGRMI